MILQYANQNRPNGEVGVTVNRRALLDGAQQYWAYEEIWTIEGWIRTQASPESAARTYIKTQQAAVERMFSANGRDLKLLMPDGRTATHHVLLNSQTLGGVRIVEPVSYSDYTGTSLVTHCKYRVVLQGIKPTATTQLLGDRVLDFKEELSREGGGYRDAYVETALGRPQRQRARRYTPYRVIQKGSAVGLYTRPTIPPPIWPQAAISPEPAIVTGAPERVGSALVRWPISWQYIFESAFPLIGFPNEWGQTYGI